MVTELICVFRMETASRQLGVGRPKPEWGENRVIRLAESFKLLSARPFARDVQSWTSPFTFACNVEIY